MHQANFQSISQLRGRLSYGQGGNRAMYERSQFMKYFANRD